MTLTICVFRKIVTHLYYNTNKVATDIFSSLRLTGKQFVKPFNENYNGPTIHNKQNNYELLLNC